MVVFQHRCIPIIVGWFVTINGPYPSISLILTNRHKLPSVDRQQRALCDHTRTSWSRGIPRRRLLLLKALPSRLGRSSRVERSLTRPRHKHIRPHQKHLYQRNPIHEGTSWGGSTKRFLVQTEYHRLSVLHCFIQHFVVRLVHCWFQLPMMHMIVSIGLWFLTLQPLNKLDSCTPSLCGERFCTCF